MSKKTIFIILLLLVLLVGCSNNEKIIDGNLNNNQVKRELRIGTNNSNKVESETNVYNPKEVKNVDLLEYDFIGKLKNGEKLYFNSKGSYFKQEYGE